MNVQAVSLNSQPSHGRPYAAAAQPPEVPNDQVSLSGSRPVDKKKLGNAIAWTGLGVQVVGAGITLTSGGWGGVGIFAVGAAMVVAGEVMKRQG